MKNTGANIYRKLMKPEDYKYFVFENWDTNTKYPWQVLVSPAQQKVLESHKQDAMAKRT